MEKGEGQGQTGGGRDEVKMRGNGWGNEEG